MVEPPPTATKESNSPCVAKSMASRKETSVGSTRTRSNSSKEMWFSRRLSTTVATGWSLARFWSVSTITRRAFISARSMPISRVTPLPKRMLEAASSNAFSRATGASLGGRRRGACRRTPGLPPEPQNRKRHRAEDHRDADARQRGHERQRAAGHARERQPHHRQHRHTAARQGARAGGEPQHAGHRAGHACRPRGLHAQAARDGRPAPMRPEREEGSEDQRHEQNA